MNSQTSRPMSVNGMATSLNHVGRTPPVARERPGPGGRGRGKKRLVTAVCGKYQGRRWAPPAQEGTVRPPARIRRGASLGGGGALLDPLAHLAHELGVAQGRLAAAVAGVPAPEHQFVLREVVQDLLQRFAAVLLRVFQ